MRKAVTLMELIVVLIIISILSSVAVSSFKLNHLRDDTNSIYLKLLNTKYQAGGYDKYLANLGSIDASIGCIDLDSDKLKTTQNYKFYASVSNDSGVNILCFDMYGRTYAGEKDNNKTTFNALISEDVNITLSYQSKHATLSIKPQSGYIKVIYW